MKNKGFSLVELIIVIAIMAILAAAIAPALIRYIDKSRRSDDVAAAETINTAVQSALANEAAYDEVQEVVKSASGEVVLASAKANGASTFAETGAASSGKLPSFLEEVNSTTVGGPKLKYTKGGATDWTIGVNGATGKPVVWLGSSTGGTDWELQPTIDKTYK